MATLPLHIDARDADARFDVGDVVVHPHHGAGVVVSRRARHLAGSEREYLELELDLPGPTLRILVPSESAAAVGLRSVIDRRRLQGILEVLEDEPDALVGSWSARQKHYRAKLKDGDVLTHAAVIRDLGSVHARSPLPSSDRALYERSRRILASELRHALGLDWDEAMAYIDDHLPARG